MGIIDVHVHLYPDEINRAPGVWAHEHGEPLWATLCTRIRKNGRPVQAFPSTDILLREMDAAGIERVILQGWYWQRHDNAAAQNRFFADCVRRHPDRLAAFGTLHPAAGLEAMREEIRKLSAEGFCGLGELSPHSQGVAADDPVLAEVFALAGELRLPVNLHVSEPAGKNYPGKVPTPLEDFVGWARQHPRTTFMLAHWGARLPLHPVLGDPARSCSNLVYDAAASPLNYGPEVYHEMVQAVGVARLFYGSDYPLDLYPQYGDGARLGAMAAEVRRIGLGPQDEEAFLGGNARRLFGW